MQYLWISMKQAHFLILWQLYGTGKGFEICLQQPCIFDLRNEIKYESFILNLNWISQILGAKDNMTCLWKRQLYNNMGDIKLMNKLRNVKPRCNQLI